MEFLTPLRTNKVVDAKSVNARLETIDEVLVDLSESADSKVEQQEAAYTVATLPAAADHLGRTFYCSNGDAGQPALVFSSGTQWLVAKTGAVAAVE